MDLLERTLGNVGEVDRQNNVIRRVKVIGLASKNGRQYSPEALKNAVNLYENATVNLSHPKRTEADAERGFMESPGFLSGVRYESDGLYADLHLYEKHPATALILERATKNPKGFGLSHNADGSYEKQNGRTVITKINRVRSVDVVGIPATTAGLFESLDTAVPDVTYGELLLESRQFGHVDTGSEYDALRRQPEGDYECRRRNSRTPRR